MSDRRSVRAGLEKIAGFIPERDRKTYHSGRFYLKASDQRGHSAQMRYDLPPADRAMMSELIACGLFPYRSYADIIRDAVHHRCHYLLDQDNVRDIVPEVLDNLARREIEEIVASRKRALRFYAQIKTEVRSVLKLMDAAEMPEWAARQMLDDLRGQAEKMTEPFRGKLLRFLVEAGAAGGLNLVEDSDDDGFHGDPQTEAGIG